MPNPSLSGMIKEISQGAAGGINVMACVVDSASPLRLRFQGDKKILLDKDVLTVPSHVSGLTKGKTVYVTPVAGGESFFVLGRE